MTARALNFFRGKSGDLDLHSSAYYPTQACAQDDADLWKRATSVSVAGTLALIPSVADQIAIAIAHGSLSAHAHSDWLVDIATAIARKKVDWQALILSLERRSLLVPAASALGYLRYEIGCDIPNDAFSDLLARADRSGHLRSLALLEAKFRSDFNFAFAMARGLVKQARLFRERAAVGGGSRTEWRAWRAHPATSEGCSHDRMSTFEVSKNRKCSGVIEVRVVIRINMPNIRRRVELELSTPSRHLVRLRHFKMSKKGGMRELTFRGKVALQPDEDALILESRPSRNFRFWRTSELTTQYGSLAFGLVRTEIRLD